MGKSYKHKEGGVQVYMRGVLFLKGDVTLYLLSSAMIKGSLMCHVRLILNSCGLFENTSNLVVFQRS